MCGIAGIHRRTAGGTRRMGRLADELLLAIEHRGVDSTGVLAIYDDGRVTVDKAPTRATLFLKQRRTPVGTQARSVLLHTRYATVGTVNRRNAHPVRNGSMAAIHNGTIYNHREVFARIGRERNAAVDSEVIPAVIQYYGWDRAAKALATLTGGAAAAVVDTKQPGDLILARLQHFPLVVLVTPSLVVWASERQAIEKAWRRTYGSDVPAVGQWITVPDYTLLRVNGTVEIEAIPEPRRPKPKSLPKSTPRKRGGRTKAKARQVAAGAAARAVEDDVSALMRWTGWEREEAEDALNDGTLGGLFEDVREEYEWGQDWCLPGFEA